MNIKNFIQAKRGNNLVRGVVSSVLTLTLGAILLGFFFEIGDTLELTGSSTVTYTKIKSKGFVLLYMVIIIPIALIVGAILTLV